MQSAGQVAIRFVIWKMLPEGGGNMTRKNSQATLAIVGSFVVITILSYYSWSLTSENRTLKRLVVNTYGKLKDMTNHKSMVEKKNTLLSNRMVEMEEQRNAEKQNAETEQQERQRCTAKLEELQGDCESNSNKLKQCEDASLNRENNLLKLLKDVELDSVDSDAEKDIFVAKIKFIKDKMESLGIDYRSMQDKYSELEKNKISLDETNANLKVELKKCSKATHDGDIGVDNPKVEKITTKAANRRKASHKQEDKKDEDSMTRESSKAKVKGESSKKVSDKVLEKSDLTKKKPARKVNVAKKVKEASSHRHSSVKAVGKSLTSTKQTNGMIESVKTALEHGKKEGEESKQTESPSELATTNSAKSSDDTFAGKQNSTADGLLVSEKDSAEKGVDNHSMTSEKRGEESEDQDATERHSALDTKKSKELNSNDASVGSESRLVSTESEGRDLGIESDGNHLKADKEVDSGHEKVDKEAGQLENRREEAIEKDKVRTEDLPLPTENAEDPSIAAFKGAMNVEASENIEEGKKDTVHEVLEETVNGKKESDDANKETFEGD